MLLERIDRTEASLTEELTMSGRNLTQGWKEKMDKMSFDFNKRQMELD